MWYKYRRQASRGGEVYILTNDGLWRFDMFRVQERKQERLILMEVDEDDADR